VIQISNSLLQDLLDTLPSVNARTYYKSSLTALSHAMEDLVLVGEDAPLVIANFQQERYYRQEAVRYQEMAQKSDRVYVLAAPETDFASAPAPYNTIGLHQADGLAQEWHLVIIADKYAACLICREHAAPIDSANLDSARQFRGFWTFDREISAAAARLLCDRIAIYRPDLATEIIDTKHRYGLDTVTSPRPTEIDTELFTERLVSYLQLSQSNQIEAYNKIVDRERRERLLNSITQTVRQSLHPNEILTVTTASLTQVFPQNRCLLSQLTGAIDRAIEYESVTTQMSLRGKNWEVSAHPLFQSLLSQNRTIVIADVSLDLGISSHPDLQQQLQQAQVASCLLVPICYRQECLGVLELHHLQPQIWRVEDIAFIEAIASQAGVGLIQAREYQNLEMLNQQLRDFEQSQNNLIAIVGHELRTPLSTIRVCLESLAMEPDMPLQFREIMLETAVEDAERLRKLVGDFLLLSQLENNATAWDVEPVSLSDSIELAIGGLNKTVSRPKIEVNIPAKLPLVMVDGEALLDLLTKLLDNACKFTPQTGNVTIGARVVSASNSPVVEVAIADTGRGIEPKQLGTIFDRFYQTEGFLQRTVGGAGLGLSICDRIIKRLGGKIWATSAGLNCGSVFYFTLAIA
jgi:DICT domain-containing protein/signal transduction histidine kinase